MHAQVGGNLERIRVRTTLCGDRTEQLDKIYKGNERLIGDTGFLMLRILLFFLGGAFQYHNFPGSSLPPHSLHNGDVGVTSH